jgi:hypothetical protein
VCDRIGGAGASDGVAGGGSLTDLLRAVGGGIVGQDNPTRRIVPMLEHFISHRPLTGVVDRILPTVSGWPG